MSSSASPTPPAAGVRGALRRVTYPLKIGSKLAIAFGILVVLLFVSAGLSYTANIAATAKIASTDEVRVPTALVSARARADLLRMIGDVRGYLALGDQQLRESYEESNQAFVEDLAELERLSVSFDAENKRRLNELQQAYNDWLPLPKRMFDLRDDQLEREPAYRLLATDGVRTAGNILNATDGMLQSQAVLPPSSEGISLLSDMARFESTFASMLSALRGYVTTRNRIYRQEYEFNRTANEFAWTRLKGKRDRLTANQQAALDQIDAQRTAFMKLIPEQVFTVLEGEHWREDLYLFRFDGLLLTEKMQQLLSEITTDQQARLQLDLDSGRAELARADQQNLVVGGMALLLGIAMGFLFHRNITGPIRRLTLVAEQIRAGDLTTLARIESGDEIGTLATTFNSMTGQLRHTLSEMQKEKRRADALLEVVIPLGVALSSEKDFNRLLETILLEAKSFCHAAAGTLYLRTADDQLKHVIVRDDARRIALGGTTGAAIDLPALPLHDPATGAPNQRNVAAAVALSGSAANIPNIYAAPFDIDGTLDFDAATGEPSLLVLPLTNSAGQVVGVLELRNATAPDGRIIPFDHNLQEMMESFSSLAGAAFEGYIREQSLRREIKQLQIVVNEVKRQQQVQEIIDSDFFQDLRSKARAIRKRGHAESDPSPPDTDAPMTTAPASSGDQAAPGSGGDHV